MKYSTKTLLHTKKRKYTNSIRIVRKNKNGGVAKKKDVSCSAYCALFLGRLDGI